MLDTNLIMTLSDIESVIGDYRARMIEEEDFKKKIRSLANSILNDEMAEDIERDLREGKKVMGRMRNPKTGEDEEVGPNEYICHMCGKRWLSGLDYEGRKFYCPECEEAIKLGEEHEMADLDPYPLGWTPISKEVE